MRRFLLDENVDVRLFLFLRNLGHDVTAVAIDYPASLADAEILAFAHREQRILITNDSDFGELVFRFRQLHAGVVFFRLKDTAYAVKRARLAYVLDHYSDKLDQFLVVTGTLVRVRTA